MRGPVYWAAFYRDGREVRESTNKTDPSEAAKHLAKRVREVRNERDGIAGFVSQRDRRRKVAELIDALKVHFEINGRLRPQAKSTMDRARKDFGHRRATSVTRTEVDLYIKRRLAQGAAKATINRTVQVIGQAIRHAGLPAPKFTRLDESDNVRRGFFSAPEIRAVMANLPAPLADFVEFGWHCGMRKGEIGKLRWEDLDGDTLNLRAEDSKNGEGRSVVLVGQLQTLIERRRRARLVKVDGAMMLCDLIFHRGDGRPVKEFRKSWASACLKAGLGKMVCRECDSAVDVKRRCEKCDKTRKYDAVRYEGKIFHDLRRSAARDMVRAGVPQSVAMMVTGHQTASMFKQYNIGDQADVRAALSKTQEYRTIVVDEKVPTTITAAVN